MKANSAEITRLLKTARGQIDGILRMVEENRYCIDISRQLAAAEAILKKTNAEILFAHLKSCVAGAQDETERNEKIDELLPILGKLL